MKHSSFFQQRIRKVGMVGVTHQLPAEVKERIDIIAESLNRPASEIYRQLIETALPEFEEELEVWRRANK